MVDLCLAVIPNVNEVDNLVIILFIIKFIFSKQRTALHIACQQSTLDIIMLLIGDGAKVNLLDINIWLCFLRMFIISILDDTASLCSTSWKLWNCQIFGNKRGNNQCVWYNGLNYRFIKFLFFCIDHLFIMQQLLRVKPRMILFYQMEEIAI